VLIVSYEFPPVGGPGVQRAAKFAKYLPERGWRPVVLTARPSPSRPRDESLLADIEGIEVHVTGGLELASVISRAMHPFGPGRGRRPGAQSSGGAPDPVARPALSTRLAAWISVPDDKMAWRWIAAGPAARLAAAVGADAVFSTAPPYTAHLVAMRAAGRRPWVADLRDPWSTSGHVHLPTEWHRKRAVAWERRVIERADAITVVSAPIAETLAATPSRPPVVLPNGFDPSDIPSRRVDPRGPVTLLYTGTFYGDISPLPFLDALSDLKAAYPREAAGLSVHFVGATSERFTGAVATRGLAEMVTLTSYVDHARTLGLMASADAGLMFLAPGEKSRPIYTGKLFEYLGVGVPILAMVPDGVAADLIREAEAGVVVAPDDRRGIAAALRELIASKREGRLEREPRRDVVSRFDRRAQTGILAQLLDEVCGDGPAVGGQPGARQPGAGQPGAGQPGAGRGQ
jgi:glycosyltransferase involved in cell wall biosynthesis